jgi:predicted SnoaL-like aldol condensation-catalyzing enzyme
MKNIVSDNRLKAMAVLGSLQSGDATPILTYINANNYTEHILDVPSGREYVNELINALPELKKNGTSVDIKRIIEDGDYVAIHSDLKFFGDKVGFTLFRFENGKIVEHWDNTQQRPTSTISGRSMTDGPTEIKDLDKTQANRRFVQDYVQDVLRDGKVDKITYYISTETYNQHNPGVGDGLDGLSKALESMAKQGMPMEYHTLHKVIGEGNFVLTLSEGQFAGKHVAFYDLFRVESGKIVEHWDVIQDIPPKEGCKNQNGKF